MSEPVLVPAVTRRRPLGLELALVVLVALAVLVPGIWSYSLVDPWETHYGEVAREMHEEHDWVHMNWRGGYTGPYDNEGFRSKPVLTMWLTAAGMTAVGLASDGGYSGEMVHDARTMIAIRLPIILCAVLGLVLVWWMLARLVSRRLAWLALLVVGSTPLFCLVARQGIPDMPLCACVMGAMAMFIMAMEDGERPIDTALSLRLGRHRWSIDHRTLVFAAWAVFVGVQAIYDAMYFTLSPRLGVRFFPYPGIVVPLIIVGLYALLWPPIWNVLRYPLICISWPLLFPAVWAFGGTWRDAGSLARKLFTMPPFSTMRQVYLLWAYGLLGVSVLAKGPPGVAVVALVLVCHIVMTWDWRSLRDGKYEHLRGPILMIAVFLPWHLGEWLKEGIRFIDEYLFTHILNRAAQGVDNSPGTFFRITGEAGGYSSVIGHGMWLWAALLPAAVATTLLRARRDTREGRVRMLVGMWAICGLFLFAIVQTKFHHYILPAIPALGILVAFFLDDLLARRERLHPLYAALGIGIVLLVTRDLMWEPERWIEMFVFRYDRPWPSVDPWAVDPSDGFFALGILACAALALAALPWRRLGVAALATAGVAICVWALQVYMPVAGTHWGMREAVRTYYEHRQVYGEKIVYFGARELYDDWHDHGDKVAFETFVPDTLQMTQPMTITIQLNKAEDERIMDQQLALVGTVTRIADHEVEVTLAPGERKKLDPLLARGKASSVRGRPPVRAVDADRLLPWQLYWRGENFWSGDEVFGWLPEMHTAFPKTDNVDFLKYLNDRTLAPLGRRYFVVTEAGRVTSVRAILPTARARDTFEVLDTTSNKFSLAAFYL